jgi:hypothetical protein
LLQSRMFGGQAMSQTITCAFAACVLFCATAQLRAELFSVVEITDLRGNTAFQVCTDAEKRKIEAELAAEAKAYPKALEETKAEWMQTHLDVAFPGGRIKPRALRVLTTTINREEADKLLAKDQSREERAVNNDKAEEERILNLKPTRSRRGGSNQAAVARQQSKVKEDREKEATADKAEGLLRKKLSAAAGHEIPFYGETPVEPQKKGAPKKKK